MLWEFKMDYIYDRKLFLNTARCYNMMNEYWTVYKAVKKEFGDDDEKLFTNKIRERFYPMVKEKVLMAKKRSIKKNWGRDHS